MGRPAVRDDGELPADVLVNIDVGPGLAKEVPVCHRFGLVFPVWWSAGGGDQKWVQRFIDSGEHPLDGHGVSDESDDGHVRPAVWGGPRSDSKSWAKMALKDRELGADVAARSCMYFNRVAFALATAMPVKPSTRPKGKCSMTFGATFALCQA